MKKSWAVTGLLCLFVLSQGAIAEEIAFFNDPSFVDTLGEAANLRASLVVLGHSVTDFTGTTETDWTTALAGADVVVIAEIENGDLFAALTPAARTAIVDFVAAGGGFMTTDSSDPTFDDFMIDLVNGLFGLSLVGVPGTQGGGPVSTLNVGAAAGTAFQDGPPTLPASNKVDGLLTTSLPVGALDLYVAGTQTTVFAYDVGTGRIGHLGFDWFELPTPLDWETVLDSMIEHVTGGAIPIQIDIKPDSYPNSINPYSRGVVPVAILGSATFDVTDVDVTTLAFGPNGAVAAHNLTDSFTYNDHLRDLNLDGYMDLVSHYRTRDTGITCGDVSATLTGETLDGQPIQGSDSIQTVGCRETRWPAIWTKDQDKPDTRRRDGPMDIERR